MRHRHDAFLVALADDPQQAAGLVDGGDGESGGLADAEAAGIHQAEAAQWIGSRRLEPVLGLVDGSGDPAAG